MLDQVRAAFARGDWSAVIQSAQPVLADAGDSVPMPLAAYAAEAHFRTGLAFLRERRLRAAAAEMERACARCPHDAVYQYHFGLAQHRLARFEAALAAYERAWSSVPDARIAYHFALAAVQLGGEHLQPERWPEVARRLRQTLFGDRLNLARAARLDCWRLARLGDPGALQQLPAALDGWQRKRGLPLPLHLERAAFLLAAGASEAARTQLRPFLPKLGEAWEVETFVAVGLNVLAASACNRLLSEGELYLDPVDEAIGERPSRAARAPKRTADSAVDDDLKSAQVWLADALDESARSELKRPNAEHALIAGFLWATAHVLAGGSRPWARNAALAFARGGDDEQALEAWQLAWRDLTAARPPERREERAWQTLLLQQTALQLVRLALKHDEPVDSAWLSTALRSAREDFETCLEIAQAAAAIDEPTLVKAALRPWHSEALASNERLRQVVLVYEGAGLASEAVGLWEQCLKRRPEHKEAARALARNLLGAARARLSQAQDRSALRASAKDLERAATLDATAGELWSLRGAVAAALGEIDDAHALFLRAVDLGDEDGGALLDNGDALLLVGRAEMAKASFRQFLKCDNAPPRRAAVGCSWLEHGYDKTGRRELDRALKEVEYAVEAVLDTASRLQAHGRPGEAIRILQAALRRHPDAVELTGPLIMLLLMEDRVDDAHKVVARLERLAKSTGDAELVQLVRGLNSELVVASRLDRYFEEDDDDPNPF